MNDTHDTPSNGQAAAPTAGRRSKRPRKPLKEQALGGYWRVGVYALVGAILAFSVSFIFKSEYKAVARLIIHPNDSSYAGTDSGAQVAGTVNIGGIDITKQTTLGNTLVNLATSNEAAQEIVNRVGVEAINGGAEAPEAGMISKVVNFFKVGGTGTAPTADEAAIDHVEGAVEAVVLDESWVMEITAWDPDPETAGVLANTAADVTVQQSEARFRENAVRELDYLNKQLEASKADVAAKAQAVADLQASLTTPEAIAAATVQMSALESDLSDAQAANKVIEERHAAVSAVVDKPRFDASRLGVAVISDAPARPMRYLFLLVGALVGALAGLLVTWFRAIREDEEGDGEGPDPTGPGHKRAREGRPDVRFDEVIDVREAAPVPQYADAGAAPHHNGAPAGRPLVYQHDGTPTPPVATPAAPVDAARADVAPAALEADEATVPVLDLRVEADQQAPAEPPAPSAPQQPAAPSTRPGLFGSKLAGDAPVGGDLTPSEAGSIAAARFDRPAVTRPGG